MKTAAECGHTLRGLLPHGHRPRVLARARSILQGHPVFPNLVSPSSRLVVETASFWKWIPSEICLQGASRVPWLEPLVGGTWEPAEKAVAIEASSDPSGGLRLMWRCRTAPLYPTSDSHQGQMLAGGGGSSWGGLYSSLGPRRQHSRQLAGRRSPVLGGSWSVPAEGQASGTWPAPTPAGSCCSAFRVHGHLDSLISFIYLVCNHT